jgi:hypothetical protein
LSDGNYTCLRDYMYTSGWLTQLRTRRLSFIRQSLLSVYQCSETNLMHFLFSLLRIKGLYILQALLAHSQEALHKRHLKYCVRVMSVGCTILVSLYWDTMMHGQQNIKSLLYPNAYWANIAEVWPEKNMFRTKFVEDKTYRPWMKQRIVLTHWYTVLEETKKLDRSLMGMLCLYGNVRTNNFVFVRIW